MSPRPADEAPHAPAAATTSRSWSDAWQLEAATTDGAGLTVRLECRPDQRRARYWTYLVLPELTGPVVVRDHDVPLPRQGLTIRAEGLWAEMTCEVPLEHWTYGLEAFAVRLDDPADALTGEIGERLPVGLDLEWEVDGPIHDHAEYWPVTGFVAPGIVHGEVLLGRERFEFDARGEYQRTWGERAWAADVGWWSIGCASAGFAAHVEGLPDGTVDGFIHDGAEPIRTVDRARREAESGASRVVLEDSLVLDAEVLMRTPVPVDDDTVADRALCRYRAGDAVAYGWSSVVVNDVRG